MPFAINAYFVDNALATHNLVTHAPVNATLYYAAAAAAAAADVVMVADLSRYAGALGRFAMKYIISWAPFAVTVQVRRSTLVCFCNFCPVNA
jgi:hypothetical protein